MPTRKKKTSTNKVSSTKNLLLEVLDLQDSSDAPYPSLRERYGRLIFLQTQLSLLRRKGDFVALFGQFIDMQRTTISDLRQLVYNTIYDNLHAIPISKLDTLTNLARALNDGRKSKLQQSAENALPRGHMNNIPSDVLSSILGYLEEEELLQLEFVNRACMLSSKDVYARLINMGLAIAKQSEWKEMDILHKIVNASPCPVGLLVKYRLVSNLIIHPHSVAVQPKRGWMKKAVLRDVGHWQMVLGVFSKLKHLTITRGRNKLLDKIVKNPVTIPSLETLELDFNMKEEKCVPDYNEFLAHNPQVSALKVNAKFGDGTYGSRGRAPRMQLAPRVPPTYPTNPKFIAMLKETLKNHKNIIAFTFDNFHRGEGCSYDTKFFKLPGRGTRNSNGLLDISHLESLHFDGSHIWTHLFHPKLKSLTLSHRSHLVLPKKQFRCKLDSLEYLSIAHWELKAIEQYLAQPTALKRVAIEIRSANDAKEGEDLLDRIRTVTRGVRTVKITFPVTGLQYMSAGIVSWLQDSNAHVLIDFTFPWYVRSREDLMKTHKALTDAPIALVKNLTHVFAAGVAGQRRLVVGFDSQCPGDARLLDIVKFKAHKTWWQRWKVSKPLKEFAEFPFEYGFELQ